MNTVNLQFERAAQKCTYRFAHEAIEGCAGLVYCHWCGETVTQNNKNEMCARRTVAEATGSAERLRIARGEK